MSKPRLTSARQAILDYLEAAERHLSANQVYEALTERLPSLNLSTVYRSLEYLVEHQLVSVADVGTGSPVYEIVNDTPHHHLVCLNCHHIMYLDHDYVNPFFQSLDETLDFQVHTNHLVLYGICTDCKKLIEEEKAVQAE